VVELGSGVTSVVADYVRGTPEIEHHVLARQRSGADTGEDLKGAASSWTELPAEPPRAIAAVARTVHRVRPDLVHAHSSYSGLYVRLAPGVPRRRVVYTPHCYGFERRDIGPVARSGIRGVEAGLSRRTGAVLAIGPREAELARSLDPAVPVHLVRNAVDLPPLPSAPRSGPPEAVASGRLSPQKDPLLFAAAAVAARELSPGTRWTWIGGGDEAVTAQLRSCGVEVTGWLPRDEVLRRLSTASVYVHTAAWEGCPMTLLEAAALGLPVVARRIPALSAMGIPRLVDGPREIARGVLRLDDPGTRSRAVAESRAVVDRHSPQQQMAALRAAYEAVCSAPGRRAALPSDGASTSGASE